MIKNVLATFCNSCLTASTLPPHRVLSPVFCGYWRCRCRPRSYCLKSLLSLPTLELLATEPPIVVRAFECPYIILDNILETKGQSCSAANLAKKLLEESFPKEKGINCNNVTHRNAHSTLTV